MCVESEMDVLTGGPGTPDHPAVIAELFYNRANSLQQSPVTSHVESVRHRDAA